MNITIYHPLVIFPRGLEFDYSKKQFLLLTPVNDQFKVFFGPTKSLEEIAQKVNSLKVNFGLNYLAPFFHLRLANNHYLIRGFQAAEMEDFQRHLMK